jgi:hypothetical protein
MREIAEEISMRPLARAATAIMIGTIVLSFVGSVGAGVVSAGSLASAQATGLSQLMSCCVTRLLEKKRISFDNPKQ